MREYGIGQSVPRVEDRRLLTGTGRYTDDRKVPNAAYMAIVRSPHAAARIRGIDTSVAAAMPGVVAVLTGADAEADGLGSLTCNVKRLQADGSPMVEPPHTVLETRNVNHVGRAIAIVIADTLAGALDAAEAVEVDYEVLASVSQTGQALREGVAQVWEDVPANESFVFKRGDRDAVDRAFASAAHTVALDYVISRVAVNTMEPRAAIGFYDPFDDKYTLYAGVQSPHRLRGELANNILHVPEGRVRVISPDMGGGFGMRGTPFVEHALVLWAAKRTSRPVRWTATRSEAIATDYHARDNIGRSELALDENGKFLAMRIRTECSLGGYLSLSGPHSPTNNLGGLSGTYTTPAIYAEVHGVYNHTNPTASYRGAGRPEASYALERLIDCAAYDLGIDPVELRRRNLIPAASMPYDTGFIFTYDSGDFEAAMDKALEAADWQGFPARRDEAARRGKLRGIGVASVIEIAGGPLPVPNEESAEIRFAPDGTATIMMGTHSHGQGHETAFRQLTQELLGLEFEDMTVIYGDTETIGHGKGTFGSRSICVGGAALKRASEKIIERGKQIAAHMLEAAEADIVFDDGEFAVSGTDRKVTLKEVAKVSYAAAQLPSGMELGLDETAIVLPPGPTYPNGCHVCEVEIDPDTGVVDLVKYTVADDVGVALSPMMVKGQVHGGVVQGAGQALMEEVVYDPDSGQLLSGSFMDYTMPRADNFPSFDVLECGVPSKNNPFGFKGAGEAGTVGALPSVMNAVCNALQPLGIRHVDMPATAPRMWEAIRNASANRRDAAE